uniref:SWIM-type domain-containing protein n=1 Tax=Terrapene triunguis TaxID=2587831 RepID=A0A674HU30_9SAUR
SPYVSPLVSYTDHMLYSLLYLKVRTCSCQPPPPCSHALSILKVETEMFEKYYNKMEPKDLVSHLLPDILGSSLDMGQTRARRKSKSRAAADRFIGLTVEQKNDLAQRELDETKEEIQWTKGDSERIIQNYQAVMEEADIRWADIKKAMCNFNKDIIQTISKKKGSVIASEKVLRYLEEKNHYRVSSELCIYTFNIYQAK